MKTPGQICVEFNSKNSRVPLSDAEKLDNSLYLIRVADAELSVFSQQYGASTKRIVHALFDYEGVGYNLSVTDPMIEDMYLKKNEGHYKLGACYLTVSLGEPLKGYCYKLVAAIIQK